VNRKETTMATVMLRFTGARTGDPHVGMGELGVIARNEFYDAPASEAAALVASGDWEEVAADDVPFDAPIFARGRGHASEYERIRREEGRERADAARVEREAARMSMVAVELEAEPEREAEPSVEVDLTPPRRRR
jgi:hypothetical protein